MDKKGILSRGARLFKEGIKKGGAFCSAKLFGKRSYPLFGVPTGLTSGLSPHEGSKRTLYSSSLFSLRPPKTIDASLYWNFEALLQGVQLPEHGVLTFNGATATHTGVNLTHEGKLITTFLQPIDAKPLHKHDLFSLCSKRFFPRIYRAEEAVATLATGWQGAFYHWMYDVLPRLHLIEKAGFDSSMPLYVESALAFQKESLALLGIESMRIVNASDYAAVHTPQLIVPSIAEIPTDWGCRFLQEKIGSQLEKRSPFRLYVSRSDASRRRIINEEHVFGILKKYGFEKVELTKHSFKEQAELFASAEAVVGPHGAGFSHLVFCRPGTPFLEIFSPAYLNLCYWYISERAGLKYQYLLGEGERTRHYSFQDPDIEVDVKKLEASLRLMGM